MAANSLDWKNMFNANKKTVVVEEFNKVLQSLADAYQLIGDP
jgi:hypothetical protein